MSGIVYTPQPEHECAPPSTTIEDLGNQRHPAGTVWQCDCGTTWVSQGVAGGGLQRTGGYASGALEWKPESRRARRKRERQGVRPEQLWPGDYEVKPVPSLPTEVATLSVDELASLRAKFEKAQLDGRITVATPYTVESYAESVDVPGGTVTFPFGITDEQAARVRDVFTKRHAAPHADQYDNEEVER